MNPPIQVVLDDQVGRLVLLSLVLVVMGLIFCFKEFRKLPSLAKQGFLFGFIGALLNWLVIVINGFQMPVVNCPFYIAPGLAWRDAQVGDHLLWLADRFPYQNFIYSIGDAVLLLGVVLYLISYVGHKFSR